MRHWSAIVVLGTAASFLVAFLWPNKITGFGPPIMLTIWWLTYKISSRSSVGSEHRTSNSAVAGSSPAGNANRPLSDADIGELNGALMDSTTHLYDIR